jgi:DNA-directed RNA polymerase III subunit RPC3
VLLQQNLIYYHHDADSRVTYYEANQDASYLLLRSGKIIEFIYTRYGASARDIAQNLLYLGHAKIGELLDKTASDIVSKIALKAAIEEARRASAANEQENEDGVERKPSTSRLRMEFRMVLSIMTTQQYRRTYRKLYVTY